MTASCRAKASGSATSMAGSVVSPMRRSEARSLRTEKEWKS